MQNDITLTEIILEREVRLPRCSLDEGLRELEMVRDNLEKLLQQATTIIDTPEKFYCCLHSAYLGLTIGPYWQIPLGVLILLWQDGKMTSTCPHCSGKVYILGAGGSPLSGSHKYHGICIDCREIISERLTGFAEIWQPLLDMRKKYCNYRASCKSLFASFRRKPESRFYAVFRTPAFAGVTVFRTFARGSIKKYCVEKQDIFLGEMGLLVKKLPTFSSEILSRQSACKNFCSAWNNLSNQHA